MLSTILLAVGVTLLGWGSDQISIPGHISTISQILNGEYPPHFTQFPEFEYRYHYGVNTLCAALSLLFHLPVDIGIDVLTIAAWFYIWLLLWAIGDRMFGKVGRVLLPGVVLLAGGTQPLLYPFRSILGWPENISPSLSNAISNVRIGGSGLVFRHCLQPPFMLGYVLLFSLILLLLYRSGRMKAPHYMSMGLIFVTLSFSHIVVFLTLLGATSVQLMVEVWKARDGKAAVCIFGLILSIVLISPLLHGFFAPSYVPGNSSPIVLNQSSAAFRWLGRSLFMWFGFIFPVLGFAGMIYLRQLRILWVTLFLGCLLVLLLFRYPYSWDIVKFAVVASMALSVGMTGFIKRVLQSNVPQRRILSALAVALCVFSTPVYLASNFWHHYYRPPIHRLSNTDIKIVSWLRNHVRSGELILVNEPNIGQRYNIWGGLDTVFFQGNETLMTAALLGIPRQKLQKRSGLLKDLPVDVKTYWGEGIRWIVATLKHESPLDQRILQWYRKKEIELAFRSGNILVFKLISQN